MKILLIPTETKMETNQILNYGLKGKFPQFNKAQKKEYRMNIGTINNDFLNTLKVEQITNSLGQKLLRIYCPECKNSFNFTKKEQFIKHQKRFHVEEYNKNRLDLLETKKEKFSSLKKIQPEPRLKKVDRTFYVDAALSVQNSEGKKYWKCSVVENDKNILNFVNSVVNKTVERNGKNYQTGTNSAEAYTILKVMFHLVEQKFKGSVRIFTDNSVCSDFVKRNKNKEFFYSGSKVGQYLGKACELARDNDIKLFVNWIKGTENPADYYSRH